MNVLVIAATEGEMVSLTSDRLHHLDVHRCISGVGAVNTAHALTRAIHLARPDMVIHTGICGAFNDSVHIGTVVHIHTEIYGDIGSMEMNGNFLSLQELHLPLFSLQNGTIYNILENNNLLHDFFDPAPVLPGGKAVTVNTVSGDATSIRAMKTRWNPDFENMEGAAVAHICRMEDIPYFEFRAVSNHVQPRDTAGWKIHEACINISNFTSDLLPRIRR